MEKQAASKFDKPQVVTDLDMAFGGRIDDLLPSMKEIPGEFHSWGNPWSNIVDRWFGAGLPSDTDFIAKDGIDARVALRHVGAVLRSFAPKHEHKTAGCAYLLSLWFDAINIPESAALSPTQDGAK